VTDDFLIARNPDPHSYCHQADGWPADAEVVEQVGVRSCVRRGATVISRLARTGE
jgi:hypothetical protein